MKDFLYIIRSTPLAMFVFAAVGFKLSGSNLWIAISCGFVIGVALMDVMYCLARNDDESDHKASAKVEGFHGKIITSISILIYYSIMFLIAGFAMLKTSMSDEHMTSGTVLSIEIRD